MSSVYDKNIFCNKSGIVNLCLWVSLQDHFCYLWSHFKNLPSSLASLNLSLFHCDSSIIFEQYLKGPLIHFISGLIYQSLLTMSCMILWKLQYTSYLLCVKYDYTFFTTTSTKKWSLFPFFLVLDWSYV
jgi:hypothetical protein